MNRHTMRAIILCALAVVILWLGYSFYKRSSIAVRPDNDPHAVQEIEKARKR